MDINVKMVAETKMALEVRIWRLSGDKRRNRNATEHFDSQMVTI
jgi:hypothetical protein